MVKVKLVAITKPVDGQVSPEELIEYFARVSTDRQGYNSRPGKLLSYLVRNKHWSPLEMISLVFEVECTRDISRQLLRHHSLRFQEFSQRYSVTKLTKGLRETRLQDKVNRQSSSPTRDWLPRAVFVASQVATKVVTRAAYRASIWAGVAKEQARVVLPEGLTNTRMYVSGTLRDFYHYAELRSKGGTQREHRIIALAIRATLEREFPSLYSSGIRAKVHPVANKETK